LGNLEMNFRRRSFLGSSALVLGSTLLEALTTPVRKWKRSLILSSAPPLNSESSVQFVDVAREAGLTAPNVWGETDRKRSELHQDQVNRDEMQSHCDWRTGAGRNR